LKGEEFLNIVNNVCALLDKFGMPLDHLLNYITQQELELEKVERETKDAKLKQLQVLQRYNVNMNDLDEYRRIKSQQNKLEKAERQIQYLKKELCNEQNKNFRFEYSLLISEYELNEANKILDRPIEPKNSSNGSNSTAKELTYTYNTKRPLHMHNLLKTQIWL
jgi:hypothetical protein